MVKKGAQMSLSEIKIGQNAKITDLCVDNELKDRLFSFGFAKGKKIKKINSTFGAKTIVVELDRSCVILRGSEADSIKVELV